MTPRRMAIVSLAVAGAIGLATVAVSTPWSSRSSDITLPSVAQSHQPTRTTTTTTTAGRPSSTTTTAPTTTASTVPAAPRVSDGEPESTVDQPGPVSDRPRSPTSGPSAAPATTAAPPPPPATTGAPPAPTTATTATTTTTTTTTTGGLLDVLCDGPVPFVAVCLEPLDRQ